MEYPNLIRQSPSAVVAEEDGRLIVYNPTSGGFFALNRTGRFVWDTLVNWTTKEQIASLLARKYKVSEESTRQDADKFIAGLAERGLLEMQKAKVK